MSEVTKRPDDLVQAITGIMKSAVDPEFGNRFVDLLMQIQELDLREYGVKDGEDISIEVPIVFFSRSGEGPRLLKVASIGGEVAVMGEDEKKMFTKNRLYMKLRKSERENEYLRGREADLEEALDQTNYYENENEQ